jgi:hypothetical protein
MAQLINEAKRLQKLAGILKEAPNMGMSNIALDYSNTSPNTPPGATPGTTPGKTNEDKYSSNDVSYSQLKTHGAVTIPDKELTETELDKFVEKLKTPNNPNPKIYVSRDSRTSSIDGQDYSYTDIIDVTPPNAGGKSGEEMEKIAKDLGFNYARGKNIQESIEQAVNEALRKFRKGK